MTQNGLAIRFNGDSLQEGPRFVEVEVDGKSVNLGEWKEDGDYQLLVLGPKHALALEMYELLRMYTRPMGRPDYQAWHRRVQDLVLKVESLHLEGRRE